MRLCRLQASGETQVAFYDEQGATPLATAAEALAAAAGERIIFPGGDNLLDFLPPDGAASAPVRRLHDWLTQAPAETSARIRIPLSQAQLRVPIPRPNKLFLLAGNYAQHIEEGGREKARERSETFPYVFMKPPTTTLTDPGRPVVIPSVSPGHIDWELELAVVIGRRARHVRETDALSCVAGYTVINDISDRKFRPNPGRVQREKDAFFDWMHGKWHDSFCPCGPCITAASDIADPQALSMKLRLNGEVRQDASTHQQIFPVAAVIEFISDLVTLEPGDIISTGTPAGVGSASGTFVKPGDTLEAWIEGIGALVSPVRAE
jgi:2,4-didehydro-3-deoxy-L-rhamnonate hydrolase